MDSKRRTPRASELDAVLQQRPREWCHSGGAAMDSHCASGRRISRLCRINHTVSSGAGTKPAPFRRAHGQPSAVPAAVFPRNFLQHPLRQLAPALRRETRNLRWSGFSGSHAVGSRRPDLKRLQHRRTESGGEGNIGRIPAPGDQNPAYPRGVVSRVEHMPAITKIGLKPGMEVHG